MDDNTWITVYYVLFPYQGGACDLGLIRALGTNLYKRPVQ